VTSPALITDRLGHVGRSVSDVITGRSRDKGPPRAPTRIATRPLDSSIRTFAHGHAAHAESLAQVSLGRQAIAGPQLALAHELPYLLDNRFENASDTNLAEHFSLSLTRRIRISRVGRHRRDSHREAP